MPGVLAVDFIIGPGVVLIVDGIHDTVQIQDSQIRIDLLFGDLFSVAYEPAVPVVFGVDIKVAVHRQYGIVRLPQLFNLVHVAAVGNGKGSEGFHILQINIRQVYILLVCFVQGLAAVFAYICRMGNAPAAFTEASVNNGKLNGDILAAVRIFGGDALFRELLGKLPFQKPGGFRRRGRCGYLSRGGSSGARYVFCWNGSIHHRDGCVGGSLSRSRSGGIEGLGFLHQVLVAAKEIEYNGAYPEAEKQKRTQIHQHNGQDPFGIWVFHKQYLILPGFRLALRSF